MKHAAPSILALDLGTQTGWALYTKGETVSGSFNTKLHDKELHGARFLRFRRELLGRFRGVREVWFEQVRRHEGTHAAHIYGAFWGILVSWCEENNIPCFDLEVAEVKKDLTGKGNANKEKMIAACRALGFDPEDDNEADALAILRLARKKGIAA